MKYIYTTANGLVWSAVSLYIRVNYISKILEWRVLCKCRGQLESSDTGIQKLSTRIEPTNS